MTTKRLTGSYYTPKVISDFIVNRLLSKHKNKRLTILEPSAGDGVFINSLFQSNQNLDRISKVLAIELNQNEADKIKAHSSSKRLHVECADFLYFQETMESEQFDLVIGNPPYIKKNLLTNNQIEQCQRIHSSFQMLSNSTIKNVWSAFLIRSISLVKDDGIISLVLPAELLQVNFTAELRALLINTFERIEIFTFNELLFKECKGQDTLILIAEKKSKEAGLFFHNVTNTQELIADKEDFSFTQKEAYETSKWTSHCLTQAEIRLINKMKEMLQPINQFCSSRAGIVTGANNYFILNKDNVDFYGLNDYAKPIIQKGVLLSSLINFENEQFNELIEKQIPCYIIDLNKAKIKKKSKINNYLQHGVSQKIDKRYKTQIRDNWYEIPNIKEYAPALFFKRCHNTPKFVLNHAKVLATDSAYLVTPKEGIDINSLVLSFYNSLTLVFSELNGRFYGGGVLELTPNEFKELPLPYLKFSKQEFRHYSKLIMDETDFDYAVQELDNFVLKKAFPSITEQEFQMLKAIRLKLISRRKRL